MPINKNLFPLWCAIEIIVYPRYQLFAERVFYPAVSYC
jgi:hypothetical protein